MGCYNTTGFVSGLNVRCSDPIVAIPCVIEGSGKYNPNNYYTTSQLRPISLPLFGKYDDYGSIENIEDTPSARAWKMSVCDDIEGCMKIFERSNEFYTDLPSILKHERYNTNENFDSIKDGLTDILDTDNNICLIIEHRRVYEKLIENKTNRTKDFFDDVASFQKFLYKENYNSFPSFIDSPFDVFGLRNIMRHPNELDIDSFQKIDRESKRLKEKWNKSHGFRSFYFNWGNGFDAYSKDGINGKCIFNIDGIADAFSDFSTFNWEIMKLNVGYRRPSCNCGGQEDFNDNIIKFYGFLSDFYNEDLKDEYDEDEDEE